ncbi:helix-turn-helix domain-containing protein [Pseudomonas mohnii]
MNSLSSEKNKVILDPETYHLIELLSQELAAKEKADLQIVIENSLRLCALILNLCDVSSSPSSSPKALASWKEKKAKELIDSKLSGHMSIAEVARECSLSRSHFSRAFKNSTGLSPKDWLTNSRIKKSQELLLEGFLPLAQIGVECGFSDQSHFTRAFSKCVGVPPSKWRQSKLSAGGLF